MRREQAPADSKIMAGNATKILYSSVPYGIIISTKDKNYYLFLMGMAAKVLALRNG